MSDKKYMIDLNEYTDQQMENGRVEVRFAIKKKNQEETKTITGDDDSGYPVCLFTESLNGSITWAPVKLLCDALGLTVEGDAYASVMVISIYPEYGIVLSINATSVTSLTGKTYEEQTYRFPDGSAVPVCLDYKGTPYVSVRFITSLFFESATFEWNGYPLETLSIHCSYWHYEEVHKIINEPQIVDKDHGANYYVYSKDLDILNFEHPIRACARIILPDEVVVVGRNGVHRTAYISLGVGGAHPDNKDLFSGVDFGIGCEDGKTWHPCYYDGNKDEGLHYRGDKSDETTVEAELIVQPLSPNAVGFGVIFLDAQKRIVKSFSDVILLTLSRQWNFFYRFASMTQYTGTPNDLNDGTKMVGGGFESCELQYSMTEQTIAYWDLYSGNIKCAYAVHYPMCDMFDDGIKERFHISHAFPL